MFSPLTLILMILLAGLILFTIVNYRKRLRSGCCGSGGDQVRRTGSSISTGTLPYACRAAIEGMVCQNCAVRIENAVNQEPGLSAQVSLSRRQLTVRSDQPIDRARIRQLVARAGYRVVEFE